MADKMQILFVSVLSSERLVNKIYETTGLNPGFAVQKFSRLLAKGFTASGAKVTALTNPPITRHNCKKVLVTFGKETEQDIQYKYIPFINFNFLKHLCVFLYSFFYVLFWGLRKKNEKFIVCDVLCVCACMGSLLASKLNHVKSVGIVTDLPAFAFISDDMNGRLSFVRKINSSYISKFNSYVLLTEQMDSVVNTKSKPYIVLEGLVDSSISNNAPQKLHDENKKIFLYAGGLYKIFGLDKLVDAFRSIERDDIQLSLYGSGSYVEELKQIALIDKRVVYHGVQTNDVVVEAEKEALRKADAIVWQFPIYWYNSPASLRDWQDQVMSPIVYSADNFLKGKPVRVVFTAGAGEKEYCHEGLNRYTAEEMLRPFEMTANAAGMVWKKPLGFYGCGPTMAKEALEEAAKEYEQSLKELAKEM